MISENIIKSSFIAQVLERDLRNIYNAQLLIATKNIYNEGRNLKIKVQKGKQFKDKKAAKRLIEKLQNPNFIISQSGENFTITNYIIKDLRFYDMKHIGNWKIYNRQVWGILYNNALRDIKSGIYEKTRDYLGEQLDKAFSMTSKNK